MYMWICITHRREHASNALTLPVRRRWCPLPSPQPHWPVYHTMWLLLPHLSLGTHFANPQRNGSGWVHLGAWFCAEVVYPSKDGHRIQALTVPGIQSLYMYNVGTTLIETNVPSETGKYLRQCISLGDYWKRFYLRANWQRCIVTGCSLAL